MKRVPELDGVRGTAIVLVLIWHFVASHLQKNSVLGHALSLTNSGVDLFFVLSGFLIGGILIDNRNAENYYATFYARRSLRILPLYFVWLALFFAAKASYTGAFPWIFEHNLPWWSYATFTQNFLMVRQEQLGPLGTSVTWSLSVEEQFYLLLPFLIRFTPRKHAPTFWLTMIMLTPVLRGAVTDRFGYTAAMVMMPMRGDALLLGVLIAELMRIEGFRAWVAEKRLAVCGIGTALASGTVLLMYRSNHFGAMGATWIALACGWLVVVALSHPWGIVAKALRLRILKFFGDISFGLYLVHQALSQFIFACFLRKQPSFASRDDVLATMVASIASVAVAYVSYRCFELPILSLGARFKYRVAAREGLPTGSVSVPHRPLVNGLT